MRGRGESVGGVGLGVSGRVFYGWVVCDGVVCLVWFGWFGIVGMENLQGKPAGTWFVEMASNCGMDHGSVIKVSRYVLQRKPLRGWKSSKECATKWAFLFVQPAKSFCHWGIC